ncbi:hypothetical protein HAX54_049542, partial [Datura stramonium]|nr:hypothetical protein [Datura stramonium]
CFILIRQHLKACTKALETMRLFAVDSLLKRMPFNKENMLLFCIVGEILDLYEQEQNIGRGYRFCEKAVISSGRINSFTPLGYRNGDIFEGYTRLGQEQLIEVWVRGHLLNLWYLPACKMIFIAINNALDRYQEALDPTFSSTHKYIFNADLVVPYCEEKVDKFVDVIKEYDSMTRL